MRASRLRGPARALLVAGVLAASSAAAAAPGAADATVVMAVPVATEAPAVAAIPTVTVPAPRPVAAMPTAHPVVAIPTARAPLAPHIVPATPAARIAPVHSAVAPTPLAPVAPIVAATPAAAPLAAAPPPPPVADAPAGPVAAVAAALAAGSSKNTPAWLRKDVKSNAAAIASKESPSPLRVGGMLALVATLGGIAYYARRRRTLVPKKAQKEQLRVLGSTRVGPRATAVVVEIAGKRLLLGVTDQSVSNLAWLDDELSQAAEEREVSSLRATPAERPSAAPEAQGPGGFLKVLRNAVGSGAGRQVIASDEVARTTRDEVRLSHREPLARRERNTARAHDEEILEGQVMGLAKRRKESP